LSASAELLVTGKFWHQVSAFVSSKNLLTKFDAFTEKFAFLTLVLVIFFLIHLLNTREKRFIHILLQMS